MKKVTVYHPDLDWSKEVPEPTAKVLERSGWQIVEEEESGSVTVGVQPAGIVIEPEPTDEPTEEEDPSVSSDQPSSEE